ncbi:MAG TPA: DUF58 domain-containing protein [Acidimicrobiales bacterium]|nr:DUF58 domain-containing protein [Acidimicrobiales bacterium]
MTGPGRARGAAGAGRAARRPVLPVRPLVPVASCACVLFAWALVAHNSGAGWVQAVGDVLGGVLVVGLVAPAVVVGRARVTVLESPTDATAGLPAELVAAATTRLRVRPLVPSGPEAFVGPRRGSASVAATLVVVPDHRGVAEHVVLEVASAAPFGLLWWRRRVAVGLPRPLVVAPRLGRARPVRPGRDDTTGEGAGRVPAPMGEPRGVRPYRPGDNRRWVHWPGTAHSGQLMVREMEGPAADPVTVEVRLPEGVDEAERAAERALGTVVSHLDRGTPVLLVTTEPSGPRRAVVADRRSAGRRLARAVPEPVPGHRGRSAAP